MAYILFMGGRRSGKSRLAQLWAEAAAPRRVFLATCLAEPSMAARIAAHKKNRGPQWQCVEEPLEPWGGLGAFLEANPDFDGSIVLDSLGVWINNLMAQNLAGAEILRRVSALAHGFSGLGLPAAIVSEECGQGLPPANAVAGKYADILGLANQIMAKMAHRVIWAACGMPVGIKGEVPAILENAAR